MAKTMTGDFYTTAVVPVPFINLNPGNLTTIHMAIHFAANLSKKSGQKTCYVTFYQPLYAKASELVASSPYDRILRNVVVRLGGFHMLMSFSGVIGYFMSGSGLEELLWNNIYAKNSVPSMITGDAVEPILKKLENRKKIAPDFSRTGKLWCEYWEQIDLVKMFIYAERIGDFELHLYCAKNMLPYFHSSGHLCYAKSGHQYLQQINHLKISLIDDGYIKFTTSFAVRRNSDKFWSSLRTDIIIEQVLIRSMKSEGGLARGTVLNEPLLGKWILSLPESTKVCDSLEVFAKSQPCYSEQYKKLPDSRGSQDFNDLQKLLNWLEVKKPFDNQISSLMSIPSGTVVSNVINCDSAKEIGENVYLNVLVKTFKISV